MARHKNSKAFIGNNKVDDVDFNPGHEQISDAIARFKAKGKKIKKIHPAQSGDELMKVYFNYDSIYDIGVL